MFIYRVNRFPSSSVSIPLAATYNPSVADQATAPIITIPSNLHWRRWVIRWMSAGVLLRILLAIFPRQADDDTDAYLALGQNLLRHDTYGIMDDGTVNPSIFRLPGYPIFLASLGGHIGLVFLIQSIVDLAGCLLLALFLRRYWSQRAG